MTGPCKQRPLAPRRQGWRRRIVIALVVLALLVIGGICYLIADSGSAPPTTRSPIRILLGPGGTTAVSPAYGPWSTFDGRAVGFSHDELGAAIAAADLTARVTPAADPGVVGATLAEQCWGDLPAAYQQLRTTRPDPEDASTVAAAPRALLYRVLAGNPREDHVVISLLADTAQARDQSGWSRLDATLRWSGRDWQLRVPMATASLQTDPSDYAPLVSTP